MNSLKWHIFCRILAVVLSCVGGIFLRIPSASGELIVRDRCSQVRCPQGRKPTRVCMADPGRLSNSVYVIQTWGDCGESEKFVVQNYGEIEIVMQKMIDECKSIDGVHFQGHGEDGVQHTGELDAAVVSKASGFACLFNKGAEIKLSGCNVGRGCAGDLFLMSTAETLLHQGGKVNAASFYATTLLPGVMDSVSLNGLRRIIDYNPEQTPRVKWKYRSELLKSYESEGDSLADRCKVEFDVKLKQLLNERDRAKERGCHLDLPFVSQEKIQEYQFIIKSLDDPKYLETSAMNRSSLWTALQNVKAHRGI